MCSFSWYGLGKDVQMYVSDAVYCVYPGFWQWLKWYIWIVCPCLQWNLISSQSKEKVHAKADNDGKWKKYTEHWICLVGSLWNSGRYQRIRTQQTEITREGQRERHNLKGKLFSQLHFIKQTKQMYPHLSFFNSVCFCLSVPLSAQDAGEH